MKTFADAIGRTWTVDLDPATVHRVRELTGHDLDDLAGLHRLLSDQAAIVDVLYVATLEESAERGMDDLDFGRSMGGPTFAAALDALIDEIASVQPTAADRDTVTREVEAARRAVDYRMAKAARRRK